MPYNLYRGGSLVGGIYRGTQPVGAIYRGPTLLWTGAPIFEGFDTAGWLNSARWIYDNLIGGPLALISDWLGQIWDAVNNFVASTVKFVQNAANQVGTLVTHAGQSVVNAYCGAWGMPGPTVSTPAVSGVAQAPSGITGFLNGIPLIGSFLSTSIRDWLGVVQNPLSIFNMIGNIPVVGNLTKMIGLTTDNIANAINPPINFVVNSIGSVLGTLTCGKYTTVAGAAAPITSAINYVIGIVGERARMLVPDGLMNLDVATSRVRNSTKLLNEDGYIEVRLADSGSGHDLKTQVFRRFADQYYNQGVGIQFMDGLASIVQRRPSVSTPTGVQDIDVIRTPGAASCRAGDRFRLVQSGSTHSLYKNGAQVAQINDVAPYGGPNHSIGIRMDARKELMGSRTYSAALDYLVAA